MIFNSFEYAIFLPVVFAVYWLVLGKSVRGQNIFILAASYLFYGWWDWRFLSLLIFSSAFDYFVGWRIHQAGMSRHRQVLVALSVIVNMGILGFFKYFNFFVDSLKTSLGAVGVSLDVSTLHIILPVGISFYTFQSMSYTLDVYRRHITPTKDLVAFLAYVAYFPQLVAGPIERAGSMLPQILAPRSFNWERAKDGLRRILWGLFKKVVIADNLAPLVNGAFAGNASFSGSSLALATVYFAFQIYCDFSAYSDIAIGSSQLLGIRLMQNFNYPYFSRSPGEFWKRWHISLSTWFRDYVYIPLGGSRRSPARSSINLMITFLASGLWHGASWNFILWGFLNGLLVLVSGRVSRRGSPSFSRVGTFLKMILTFALVCLGWVFFRSPTLTVALDIVAEIISPSLFSIPELSVVPFAGIALLAALEAIQRHRPYALDINHWPLPFRWIAYYGLTIVILRWGAIQHSQFIYFQF